MPVRSRLDVTDLACPLPVLRTSKRLRELAPGEMLEVLATDRSAVGDFEAFCKRTKNELVAWEENAGVFRFQIRKLG